MQRIRIFLLVITALVTASSLLPAQQWNDCVYIWNGFSQNWGYNHRLNRLGDYLDTSPEINANCRAEWVHTAASGSGADLATFSSRFTKVRINDLQAVPFAHTLLLEGKEGELIRGEMVMTFRELASADPSWSATAVLNGFDIRTAVGAKADKMEHFSLGIDSVWTTTESGVAQVRLVAEIRFSCSSPECELFKNEVRYELEIRGLLLSGQGLRVTSDHLGRGFAWTRDSLPDANEIDGSAMGQPGFPTAALGLQQLTLTLDDEHHFADLSMYVAPGDYEPSSGRYPYRAGLYFGQWKPEQYAAFEKYYTGKPKIPSKWAVQRSSGSAIMEMGLVLLQFQSAAPESGSASGEIHWLTRPGKQASAQDSMAVSRQALGD